MLALYEACRAQQSGAGKQCCEHQGRIEDYYRLLYSSTEGVVQTRPGNLDVALTGRSDEGVHICDSLCQKMHRGQRKNFPEF